MQTTLEEIIDLLAESLSACFFIGVVLYFITSGESHSLGAIVSRLLFQISGG